MIQYPKFEEFDLKLQTYQGWRWSPQSEREWQMTDALELWRKPETEEMYMICGWRQWADAGNVSSALPLYLIQQTNARKIGQMSPDGFYIFQVPGTHDLMRPMVKFQQGFPESLQSQKNELYFTGDEKRGAVIFLGDEPHLDVERYVETLLTAARTLGVKRIYGLGGVYGEVPYNKERIISANYSMSALKPEVEKLAVTLSDYQGGASIGSYLCRRAGDSDMEYVGLYAFVPAYDFASAETPGAHSATNVRIENDYMAWLGILRRINYRTHSFFNLAGLEQKSRHLITLMESKIDEMEKVNPQLGIRDYLQHLSDDFTETPFTPLEDVWEENLRRLFDKLEGEEPSAGDEA